MTKKDWYLSWFGKEYLDLYKHRNDDEARQQVEFILKIAALQASDNPEILDIACSRARHSIEFAKAGFPVVGIDRSVEALEIGRKAVAAQNLNIELVEADMRKLPFEDKRFSLAVSMFTSFGYFPTDEEHQNLLIEWRRCLKNSGQLLIDYLNKQHVIETLKADTTEENDSLIITQSRSINTEQTRVEKIITLEDKSSGESREFKESVRMYEAAEMIEMLKYASFDDIKFYGNFDGSEFTSTSPRLVILAKAI